MAAHKKYDDDYLGLSFYDKAPDGEVGIEEFKDMALSRLKVLHCVERRVGYEAPMHSVLQSAAKAEILAELEKERLLLKSPTTEEQRTNFPSFRSEFARRDAISHVILRLGFCKTRDARDWFLKQEQRLFLLRLEQLKKEAKDRFYADTKNACKVFDPKMAGKDGWPTLQELQQATSGAKKFVEEGGRKRVDGYEDTFYELPFNQVTPNLIAKRKVVLRKGVAFVPNSQLSTIIADRFKAELSKGLNTAFNGLNSVMADQRVGEFIRVLQENGMNLFVARNPKKAEEAERLSLANFEEMLKLSFPPCMRQLVETQRVTLKHLKHQGRLQLRPFLKDCGFTMEESMQWWRTELTRDPEIGIDKYEKNYTYDTEHTYGRKGHMKGSHTCSCARIINYPIPSAGQVHSCPFRTMEIKPLKEMLHSWGLPAATLPIIEDKVLNGKHYQIACVEYFKAMHPGHEGDGVGNHPLQYYQVSCAYCKPKSNADDGGSAGGTPEKDPARNPRGETDLMQY